MEFAIPIPRQNEITGSFSKKWYDFVHSFHSQYFSGQSKKSFLLHYGSQTLNEIHLKNNISEREFTRLMECMEALENQCLFQIVICFLRHLFFTHCRQVQTSLKEFYAELRLLSEWCSFEVNNRDDLVKKQLISNIRDESARDMFLNNDNLTATNIVDVCDLADAQCRNITPDFINVYSAEKEQQTLNTNNPETNSKKDFGLSTVLFPEAHDTEMTKGLNINTLLGSVGDDQGVNASDLKITLPLTLTDLGSPQNINDSNILTNCNETTDHVLVCDSLKLASNEISCTETTISQPKESESRTNFITIPGLEPTTSYVLPLQNSNHHQEVTLSVESEIDESKVSRNEIQIVVSESVVDILNNGTVESIIDISGCENDEAENNDDFSMSVAIQDATNESYQEGDNRNDSNYNDQDSMEQGHIDFSKECNLPEVPSVFMSLQSAFSKISQCTRNSGHLLDIFSCNLCNFTSIEKIAIKEHSLHIHSSLKCYACTACNSKFTSQYQLENHVRLQHLNVGEPKCEICDKAFISQSSLLQHLQAHSLHKNISCNVCSATFASQNLLSKHISDNHSSTRRKWVCLVCETPFSTRTELSDHISEAHAKFEENCKSKRQWCKHCDIYFSDAKSKARHYRNYHKNNKPLRFACNHCDYKCGSNDYLVSHLRTHTGEKPFMCEICGRTFSQSTSLDNHMRTHTGEKPFKCQYCDMTFSTKGNKYTHERRHRNERRYICEQCGKAYHTSYDLRGHMETHNEVKQFVCHCGLEFNSKSKLIRHKKWHLS